MRRAKAYSISSSAAAILNLLLLSPLVPWRISCSSCLDSCKISLV